MCSSYASRYDGIVEEFELLREHFIGLDGENVQLSEQLRHFDSQIAKRAKEMHDLEQHHKFAQMNIESYENEYQRADVERQVLEVQLKQLDAELGRLREGAERERVRSDQLARENHQLHKQLAECLAVREKHEDVWAMQQDMIKRLECRVEEEERGKAEFRVQLLEAEREMSKSCAEIEALRKEVAVAAASARTKEKERHRFNQVVSSLKTQIQRQESANANLQSAKAAVEAEMGKTKVMAE